MDAHHSSRHPPLKQWADGDSGGSHRLPAAKPVAARGCAPEATPKATPAPAVARPARSALREERHPNAVTAPPIHRGSMPPKPWQGFWKSIAAGVLAGVPGVAPSKHRALDPRLRGDDGMGVVPAQAGTQARGLTPAQDALSRDEAASAWERVAANRRTIFLLFTLLSATLATVLFAKAQPDYDSAWLRYGQIALFAILSTWVVTGFTTALMGFWVTLRGDAHALSARSVRHHALGDDVRTAIIMPICNEDVATVFAGLRATCESMAGTGHARQFDVFVLSDSSDPAIIAAERAAWVQLREALATQPTTQPGQEQVEVYYRLRQRRTHRKAGNVADFCRRWGRDYRYMVVLDADSVMSGDCLVTLAKLMEAHPRAGIIQTATQSIGHATLHARTQQFASRVTGRLFTLGMQFWQLGASHYWGHNAIIRVAPFMAHCALAPIEGKGGLAGPILSHDFVEAALMRRAGYAVWLVSDLTGSYEQQPPDLLSELQRDRRWCQGNLQNARLIAEPGIDRVHRAMFGVGAMSYVAAPLWLAFMTLGTSLWMAGAHVGDNWHSVPGELLALWAWTLCILLLPRVLGVVAVLMRGDQHGFGGGATLVRGALLETGLALLQAPIRMVAHSLFVAVALTGLKLEWKSPPREATGLGWRDAFATLAPLTAVIAAAGLALATIDLGALLSLVPVAVPLLLAVPLAVLTSRVRLGERLRAQGWLLVPEEARSPAVLRRARHHAQRSARGLRAAQA